MLSTPPWMAVHRISVRDTARMVRLIDILSKRPLNEGALPVAYDLEAPARDEHEAMAASEQDLEMHESEMEQETVFPENLVSELPMKKIGGVQMTSIAVELATLTVQAQIQVG